MDPSQMPNALPARLLAKTRPLLAAVALSVIAVATAASPALAGAAKPAKVKARPVASAVPAKRSAEDVAIDFYGLAWKLENGARNCVASEAGNSESLQGLLSTMQGLTGPYQLGRRLYSEGRRTPDTKALDAEIAADNKDWPQKSPDQVDSACSLLGLGTILGTQAMSDELDQFAPSAPANVAPIAPMDQVAPVAQVAPLAPTAPVAQTASVAVAPSLKIEVLRAVIESFNTLGIDSVDRPGNIAANTVPDKAPVLAITPATEERLPLQAFGRDVVYMARSQIREQMLINFLKIDSIKFSDGNHAEVRVFYPYRAIGGTVKVQRTATGWQTDSNDISFNPPGAQLFYSELFDGKTCVDGTEYARWKNAFVGRKDGQCEKVNAKPESKTGKARKSGIKRKAVGS